MKSMLKIKFFPLLFLFFLPISLSSQKRIEFFGGYSVGSEVGKYPTVSAPKVMVGLGSITALGETETNKNALTLGLNLRIYKNLSVGLSWTGLNSITYSVIYPTLIDKTPFLYMKYKSNAVLFNVKYDWAKIGNFHFYSRGGVGAVFISKPSLSWSNNNTYVEPSQGLVWKDGNEAVKKFAWQISYLGLEYRPLPFVGLFAEGGLGYQGAFLAGLKVFL